MKSYQFGSILLILSAIFMVVFDSHTNKVFNLEGWAFGAAGAGIILGILAFIFKK